MVKAKEDTARMRDEMEKSMRDSAVELAVAMAKKLLTGVLSGADQHKLIAKQVKEIGSMKVS
jgi:F0F1-type ATP synthase membrane subunit b/b'